MDEAVELELVDLARVELLEAFADVLEQHPELLLVVGADDRSGLAPPGLLAQSAASASGMAVDRSSAKVQALDNQRSAEPAVAGVSTPVPPFTPAARSVRMIGRGVRRRDPYENRRVASRSVAWCPRMEP